MTRGNRVSEWVAKRGMRSTLLGILVNLGPLGYKDFCRTCGSLFRSGGGWPGLWRWVPGAVIVKTVPQPPAKLLQFPPPPVVPQKFPCVAWIRPAMGLAPSVYSKLCSVVSRSARVILKTVPQVPAVQLLFLAPLE
jgi:hypothetical protein